MNESVYRIEIYHNYNIIIIIFQQDQNIRTYFWFVVMTNGRYYNQVVGEEQLLGTVKPVMVEKKLTDKTSFRPICLLGFV